MWFTLFIHKDYTKIYFKGCFPKNGHHLFYHAINNWQCGSRLKKIIICHVNNNDLHYTANKCHAHQLMFYCAAKLRKITGQISHSVLRDDSEEN